jgi:hypothetical protein
METTAETDDDRAALKAVRKLEQVVIAAICKNDADAIALNLDEKFIYVTGQGKVYDKQSYILAVRSHELTYSEDFDLTETDSRADGDVLILLGMKLGHARLDGEQQVYHLRSTRIWRARGDEWKLLFWQSSEILVPPSF